MTALSTAFRLGVRCVLAGVIPLAAGGTARAQQATEATPVTTPSPSPNVSSPAPATTPPASPPTASASAAQRAPDRFAIEAFDVSGVTKLSADEIETIVYPFAGPDKSAPDVEAARKAVQDAYAAKGYEAVVVEVPTQNSATFAAGIVQIAVQEAPLGRVTVTGAKHHSADRVLAEVPSLAPGQPIDLRALQGDVAAANRFPDRTINPSFRPGKQPGSVDVELKVKDEAPYHASLELNNDNSPSTQPLRLIASARYTNLWGLGHTISGTFIVAPQRVKDSEVFSGSYTAPLIGTPWSFLLYGYKSNSDIAALGGTNVLGNGYQVGLRAIYKLPADKSYQTISFGPDFKDFKQDISIAGVSAGSAPIRYVPFVTEYSLSGASDKSSYDFTLGATIGLRLIKRTVLLPNDQGGLSHVDQFRNREVGSNENFVHLNFTGDYSRTFAGDFIAAYTLSAQYADSHLITNEQYAIGGLTSVRGYYQSEAVGDQGVAQSIELRSPSFATRFGAFVDEARLFGFVDAGYVHVRNALAEQQDDFTLVGVGGGARVRLFDLLNGEISVGVPLRDGPASDAGDPRIIFVVKGAF